MKKPPLTPPDQRLTRRTDVLILWTTSVPGDPNDSDLTDFQTLLEDNLRANDMLFFIILGSGVTASMQASIQTAVCAVGGIFIHTPDNDPAALDVAMASYYQYLAVGAMLNEVQPTRWSEPYTSIPDIWGEVVSAVTPVFDKSGSIWTMIGVSAVDLPLCEVRQCDRPVSRRSKPSSRSLSLGEHY